MGDIITNFITPPLNLINQELEGIYGRAVLKDMDNNIKLYEVYEKGAKFASDNVSFTPSQLRYKIAKTLIDKEVRFMLSKNLEVKVVAGEDIDTSTHQKVLNLILEKNFLHQKLLQAAKDCFIAKRVACFLTFNEDGVGIRFAPSLEFVYDTDENNPDKLTRIVAFYNVNDDPNKAEQRIYRKKYWMENGYCYVEEGIYNGVGELLEEKMPTTKTLFTYIPAVVILNGGLTGDLLGTSDIEEVMGAEAYYSKLANGDMDAERATMYPIKFTRDINPEDVGKFSMAPGALWDAHTDQSAPEGIVGEIGQLESSMSYSQALKITLDRIKSSMYEQLDVPDIANLQGKLSSGKELEAIYWGLVVRCDEKFIVWREALKFMCHTIFDGLRLYPDAKRVYMESDLPDIEYEITVENQYPLPGDENEEKTIDLAEVSNKTRSIKSYLVKWRNMTDKEAELEIEQIAKERQLLEDSFFNNLIGGEGAE